LTPLYDCKGSDSYRWDNSERYQILLGSICFTKDDHYKFVNLDNSIGQCFNLRHSKGDQPSKLGQLMFDTIDKIVIPRTSKDTILDSIKKLNYISKDGIRVWIVLILMYYVIDYNYQIHMFWMI
jgi:hypothetical protein